jgi:hypothetical protein
MESLLVINKSNESDVGNFGRCLSREHWMREVHENPWALPQFLLNYRDTQISYAFY